MNKLSLFLGSATVFNRTQRREAGDAHFMLNKFDDHMLKDIGLSRQDVERMGRGR